MRTLQALLLITANTLCLRGAELKYPVNEIPADLLKSVNVVVREDAMVFQILAKNHATLKVRYAATILNSKGDPYARKIVRYSKAEKVNAFSGVVFDARGAVLKKLKNNEIQDQSISEGGTLYRDDRIKIADLSQSSYPYTVEYEYDVEYKYLYEIPDTWLLSGEHVSCERVSYQLIFPPNLRPRYHLINITTPPTVEKAGNGLESWKWTFEHLLPIELEGSGPSSGEVFPRLMLAPSAFEYEGYEGDMSSWESYGNWIALLNKGRDVLPAETRNKVKEITAGLATDEAKARALYKFVQNKTRYVNISLGIGGLQPFPAEVVDQNSYGDCKALSNYMLALLKEAGIHGYYATIMAGDNASDVISAFPSHQANHAIVAIPQEKDTIWLECTSQTTPFGYMGKNTGDRKALLITENGGKLVNTTRYPDTANRQIRNAEVILDAAGNARSSVRTVHSGLQYENNGLDFILNDQYDSQKKWILANTSIPSFNLDKFRFENRAERVPSAVVELELTLSRLASISGKRLFLTPNLMNRSAFLPPKLENRKTDIVSDYGYVHIDTITYQIPENLYPEFVPQPVILSSIFGAYEASFTIESGKLVYVRHVTIHKGRFLPSHYDEYSEFYKSVVKADNVKLVFLTKT